MKQLAIKFRASVVRAQITNLHQRGKFSELFLEKTSRKIDWHKVKGFRNIIAHNYFGIDAEEVWQIIHTSLPQLKSDIEIFMK